MTAHRLLLPGEYRGRRLSTHEFVWNEPDRESSFNISFGPTGLSFGREVGLGSMPNQAMDFVRLAVAVYLVDRTSPRPDLGWDREFELDLPVSDPDRWNAMAPGLSGILDYLTGDAWDLTFRHGRPAARRRPRDRATFDLVCLFSGGADSFAGASLARRRDTAPLLLGHWDSTLPRGVQLRALEALNLLPGQPALLLGARVARRDKQLMTGAHFGQESTSRSRSLVFLALGIAAAAATDATELWVPENGWVSLNTPLGGDRRASLSTRTTHPALVGEIGAMVRHIGLDVTISNPWEGRTKGEVVAWMRDEFGADDASDALSVTHSCARSDARWVGMPPDTHCGVCFACLVRRGAFISGHVADHTRYIELDLRGDPRRPTWLSPRRLRDLQAVRATVAHGGFSIEDVLALNLPERLSPTASLALANRGLAEVGQVDIP
jgi:hypothetical protein